MKKKNLKFRLGLGFLVDEVIIGVCLVVRLMMSSADPMS